MLTFEKGQTKGLIKPTAAKNETFILYLVKVKTIITFARWINDWQYSPV